MNELFLHDQINDYMVTVTTKEKLTYSIENNRYQVTFYTEAGTGRNYFKVLGVYDKKQKRSYNAQRYHIKFIPIVREFSALLYKRYKETI